MYISLPIKKKNLLAYTIFEILEFVDQHNLNKFFVRKMKDFAGICYLHCVSCSTVELFYEVVMLRFQIGGFQSLLILGSVLVGMFLKSWHCISCQRLTDLSCLYMAWNRLSCESFRSSYVRRGREHTVFTFELKNTLLISVFPVNEKILCRTNGIVLFQEHMKWVWVVQNPDSFNTF